MSPNTRLARIPALTSSAERAVRDCCPSVMALWPACSMAHTIAVESRHPEGESGDSLKGLLSLYGYAAREGLVRAAKAWPVALSVPIYEAILLGSAHLTAPLGMVGGFIQGFLLAAC